MAQQTQAQEPAHKRALVNRLIDENKDDSAIIILEQMLSDSPKDSIEHQGRILHQIGKLLAYKGSTNDAIKYYKLAIEKYNKVQNRYLENRVYQNMAGAYADSGELNTAITLIQKALRYMEEIKDTAKILGCLLDMGLYYYENNQTNKALESYVRLVNLPNEKELIQKAKAYNQMGNIWSTDLNNEKKALEYYLKSLEIKLQLDGNHLKSITASYNNIGLSYKILGQLDSATYYYKKALETGKQSGAFESMVEPLNNLANIYKRKKDFATAEEYLREALQYIKYSTLNNQILIYTSLGILLNDKSEYKEALEYFKIAEKLANKGNNLQDIAEVYEFLIQTYLGLGQSENVLLSLNHLLNLKDSITNLKLNNTVAEMMIKYETHEKERNLLLTQQRLLEQQLKSKQMLLLFLTILLTLLAITSYIYIKFRRKQALAKQAALELSLHEQKVKNKIQEERLRISRELHDNIGSHLTLINALTEEFDDNDNKAKKVRKSILLSMKELRKTVWLLNKESNSIDEIVIRLRDFLSSTRDNGINIQIQATGNTNTMLDDIQTTHLFRTIQEAVNNAIKYAQCNEIKISLNIDENNMVNFEIIDNGKGFDKENTNSNNGLTNMKFRMEQLKGELFIESQPGMGTTIKGVFKI
ncbi:MAG: tetratricopeptide repeat protein [Bacteroidetes bacterium]|nr:tetratricopeptide repeat protein [Bacteroidota bacterium]